MAWVFRRQWRASTIFRRFSLYFVLGCVIGVLVGFTIGQSFRVGGTHLGHGLFRDSKRAQHAALGIESPWSWSASSVSDVDFNQTLRWPDVSDTFASYKYRQHERCNISSLHLHMPFGPLCQTRRQFLDAYSGGGRIGFDAPFSPRGCDMRWFTTEEVCDIFARFEKVIVVGDSMMRHVVGALNVLLRKDLGYGAVTQWNFNEQERSVVWMVCCGWGIADQGDSKDCFCNKQFDVKACSVQGIFTTASVLEHDPGSLACPNSKPLDLVIEMMVRYPLDPMEVARFQKLLSTSKPNKPYAFVFGHGLWNDLDLAATVNWLDGVIAAIDERAPYCQGEYCSKLMVTPNAAGIKKPDQWISSQGDKALQMFETAVREEAALRSVEHLGTWNMSIQMSKWDGVHLDLKGNLVKAMGIMNWLALLDDTN